MKNIITLFILSIFLGLGSCASKTNKEPSEDTIQMSDFNPNNYDEIGFKCGAEGSPTKLVRAFSKLIEQKNYAKIRMGLFSKNPGWSYLSTLVCEHLETIKTLQLFPIERFQIKKNKLITDTLFVLSGCTHQELTTVSKLISESNTLIHKQADFWLSNILKENSKFK